MSDSPSTPAFGDPPPPPNPQLPPVEPPSAGFILQLFVIPAVIVAVLVVVVALFGRLAEGSRDATRYVESIRTGNPNVRWRAAYELANLIHNEPRLAEDSRLLGELAALLESELARSELDEDVVRYLAAALGAFRVASARTGAGQSIDPAAVLADALASTRPIRVRVAAAESLARLAATDPRSTSTTAVAALEQAALDPEPELRQRAVYALGLVGGERSGATLRAALDDADRYVRYNAANALARRGDPAAREVLREMLSTPDLAAAVQAENPSETRSRIETIQLEALAALQAASQGTGAALTRGLQSEIAALKQSDLASVRLKSGELLQQLGTLR